MRIDNIPKMPPIQSTNNSDVKNKKRDLEGGLKERDVNKTIGNLSDDIAYIRENLKTISLKDEGLSKVDISIESNEDGEIIFTVKDKETGDVIREVPTEEIRQIRKNIEDYISNNTAPKGFIFNGVV